MARLLNLCDELIILICSNISKPSHLLQLALANKRIHGIAIQHLYRNLTFNEKDYPPYSSNPNSYWKGNMPLILDSSDQYDSTAPHSNILRLSNMISSNILPAGRIVTSLTINIGVSKDCNKLQTLLSLLLPQLSALKDLDLKGVRRHVPYEYFSVAPLKTALSNTSQTLQRLSMHFFVPYYHNDGWTLGSLHDFSKLKYLSVQGGVLLGQCDHMASTVPPLDSILPPGLVYLRLYWCVIKAMPRLCSVLAEFLKDSLTVSRKMKKLVVQLDAQATDQDCQNQVESFERSLTDMSEEARQGNLELRLALEWREEYHWMAPLPMDEFFDQMRQIKLARAY